MIDLKQIKTILQVAGISRLKIGFVGSYRVVNVEYVFKGKPGTKQITYQEIIDSFTIGMPGPPAEPGAGLAKQLSELPGENENNGLDRT